jgi:hypothetical protein
MSVLAGRDRLARLGRHRWHARGEVETILAAVLVAVAAIAIRHMASAVSADLDPSRSLAQVSNQKEGPN